MRVVTSWMSNRTANVGMNVRFRRVRDTIFSSGKTINITSPESVFLALLIQHAKRMRRIISSSKTCPVLSLFSFYLINGPIFGNKIWNIKCVF